MYTLRSMSTAHNHDCFEGRHAVIATMHGKERVIGPLLAEAFGMSVSASEGVNTDRFGTFTRDVPRAGTQLEAARKKASAALKEGKSDLVIASEGAYAAHPDAPFLCQATELVLLVDRRHNLEIAGYHRSSQVHMHQRWVCSPQEAVTAALAQDFPRHGIVVRISPHTTRGMCKDLQSADQLAAHAQRLLRWPWRRKIFLETDMRAHRNPTRMACIAAAATDLVSRMQSRCPQCATPGFGISSTQAGLPCEQCGMPTRNILKQLSRCGKCGYTKEKMHPFGAGADPGDCQHCNP